ncbi:VOC family protein [Nocardiopsis changdeensis]|uniref:VOC family protein n=1 Tax=Nocardiopsis changdeensis TaxID=2831969 RepID=A0ABX8BE00_9ACTN|nr:MULTISPECIES: VOC family protein [Nocardiopsis]QUX20262.1 VOC family protein [Nocardiopsis changdeensis]QYX36192.1 VOC family protein [Nocardiopsis sp. MT53]
MGFPKALDHLVYAVPDLAEGVDAFEELTGVRPAPGGRHPVGSANALVALTVEGERAPHYLEVIGPDPERADPGPVRVFGLASLERPHLATFAVGVADLAAAVARARAAGHDPGDAEPWSRATPDGRELRWSLAKKESERYPEPVPFLIDWGGTPQPGLGDLPALELVSLRAEHPDPGAAGRALAALGVDLDLAQGPEPLLEAVLRGPKGEFTLR